MILQAYGNDVPLFCIFLAVSVQEKVKKRISLGCHKKLSS